MRVARHRRTTNPDDRFYVQMYMNQDRHWHGIRKWDTLAKARADARKEAREQGVKTRVMGDYTGRVFAEYKAPKGHNPRTRIRANAAMIPCKLKRMPNGTVKVYVAPGALARVRNPAERVYAVGNNQLLMEARGLTQSEAVALLKRHPLDDLGMHNYIWKSTGTFAGHVSWKKVRVKPR